MFLFMKIIWAFVYKKMKAHSHQTSENLKNTNLWIYLLRKEVCVPCVTSAVHPSLLSWASWELLTTTKKLLSTEGCQIRFSQHVYSIMLGYEMYLHLLPCLYTWKMFLLHEEGKTLKDECMHAHASGFIRILINHCCCFSCVPLW